MTGKSGSQFSEKALLHEHDRVPVDAIRDDDDVPQVGRSASASTGGCGTPAWCARVRRGGGARELWPCARQWRAHPRARPHGATGDVITVALEREVRVLKVTGFSERRGPASSRRALI